MKIAVTGGAGYIGSHTIIELDKAGHSVVVVDNLVNSCEESLRRVAKIIGKEVPFVKADVRDAAVMEQLFKQYKPQMKKLTKNQGKMLIKLINRETNQDSYHIIKAFLGTFRAGFWQTFGRFFGVSLKQGYHPNKDKNDAMIERICVRVEQGTL